jgi:hypothetical protein
MGPERPSYPSCPWATPLEDLAAGKSYNPPILRAKARQRRPSRGPFERPSCRIPKGQSRKTVQAAPWKVKGDGPEKSTSKRDRETDRPSGQPRKTASRHRFKDCSLDNTKGPSREVLEKGPSKRTRPNDGLEGVSGIAVLPLGSVSPTSSVSRDRVEGPFRGPSRRTCKGPSSEDRPEAECGGRPKRPVSQATSTEARLQTRTRNLPDELDQEGRLKDSFLGCLASRDS